ncbi:hypothetical protein N7519_011630 [Penicillium mononematosum]|uniref:uncharacterized protein n=1 Tax=Penicillium mononematosum TaxID=268346 RepID=UPI002547EB78|nr:uncharacterized protein N7519_011630 [Penicillium mononematosum]KAJ6181169.1 hypothetical protein N7519_011630 [Penicillium mononematosum]
MTSSVNPSFFRPTRIIPSDNYRFIPPLTTFYGHISAIGFLCAVMFKRSFVSKDRAGKTVKVAKKKYDELVKEKMKQKVESPSMGSPLTSPIITMIVGRDQRLFAAHEDVLSASSFFSAALKEQFLRDGAKQLTLPDEEPEILSCVLEFLYKGDYYPRLLRGKQRNSWSLENAQDINQTGGRGSSEPTMFHLGVGDLILRDTAVYCAAEKYGLEELKRLALRKQGLQSGIPADVILRSARYAYDNTPETDSRLRAHYLALIIRSRKTFKSSGTLQMEMEEGGKLFFDLFVAMCNHMDDLSELRYDSIPPSPSPSPSP